jgi:hypothetical protein
VFERLGKPLLKDSETTADQFSKSIFKMMMKLIKEQQSEISIGFLQSALYWMKDKA